MASQSSAAEPSSVSRAELRLACAVHSAELSVLLRNNGKIGSIQMMTVLVEMLADDAKRPQPFIDLNHKLAGGGTLLTQLIQALSDHTIPFCNSSEAVQEEMSKAKAIFLTQLSYVLTLVRTYDASLLSKDGETALNLLARLITPQGVKSWMYLMAEALLQAGADVNRRDISGWTPLLRWAYGAAGSACAPLLLLRHGADLGAMTKNGWSVLHCLVENARSRQADMVPGLLELALGGYLAHVDFSLLNNSGQTALQIAEALVAEKPQDDGAAAVLELLHAMEPMWRESFRPAIFDLLSQARLLPDLAHIVLAYVDGGERRSEKQDAAALRQAAEAADGASSAAPASI